MGKGHEHIFKKLTSLALREIPTFHILDWQILERLIAPKAEEGVGNRASEMVKCELPELVQKGIWKTPLMKTQNESPTCSPAPLLVPAAGGLPPRPCGLSLNSPLKEAFPLNSILLYSSQSP